MASERPADSASARWSIANPVAVIVVCAIGLTFLGLTILFSASVSLKQDPYFYLDKQVVGRGGGGACFASSRAGSTSITPAARRFGSRSAPSAPARLVLIPHLGVSVKGSRRWLGLRRRPPSGLGIRQAGDGLLPGPLPGLNQTRIGDLKRGYLYPLAIIGAFAGLILLEPDFGTAALALLVGLVLLFLAGAKWRYILPTIGLAAAAFAVLVAHNPNRLRRFTAFLDVEGNKQGGTYQLYQSLEAFAAGGRQWRGPGPGAPADQFPARGAHRLHLRRGGGGARHVVHARGRRRVCGHVRGRACATCGGRPNLFHFLLAAGCLLLMCLQSIINLGVVTGILPTKGMSLPFISAGLSNLLLMGLAGRDPASTPSAPGAAPPCRPGAGAMREVLA